MSEIYDDFLPYRDQYGLNQVEKGATSQNGALATVEYLLCLQRNNAPELHDEIIRVRDVFLACEPKPGLSVRFPGDTEYQSMDNTAAELVFSYLYGGRDFAYRMREHGYNVKAVTWDPTQAPEKNALWWPRVKLLYLGKPTLYWNNSRPEAFCFDGWWGRSPGFLGLIDRATHGYSTFFRNLSLLVGQFLPLTEALDETSNRKLSYVVWQLLITQGKGWKAAYWLWDKLLRRQYERGIADVYEIYLGAEHPAVKWS